MGGANIPLLEVRELTHRFGDGTLGLSEVSFVLAPGELLLIAGRNGSGKTLLMKHLNGLLRPTSGEVLLEGRPIHENLAEARRRIGLVFQDADSQIVGQTVREDVAFGPGNLRLPDPEIQRRTEASMCAVGIEHLAARPSHLLSGGEKRRLAVAGVLAMDPSIVIFDEPFTALDYPGVSHVLAEILRLHAEGRTLIVITHEVEKILAHTTRVLVLDGGRLVEDGEPSAIIDRFDRYGVRRPVLDERGIAGVTWLP